ncbi:MULTISPECIES: hypothetical protein [Enterococcus]|uniref:hypothetical protein n=1 Tax=Enterococcus TaxID=1350 RepID=UPI00232E3842|nr:hypothetical protein [Enterococcus avium]MDB1730079.1 hypothetical protein [Enterococcus avium]MDB1734368.1 hypothetical protein [Enterococcus avium]
MDNFQALYDHSQFQEFRHLIEDVLATMKPKIQPFVGLPREMKVQFKHNPKMYQRYVLQRVRYINERERKRKQFMRWCTKEVIEQCKEIYPDEDPVQLVTEIVSGLTQLFFEHYESITDFSLEINF